MQTGRESLAVTALVVGISLLLGSGPAKTGDLGLRLPPGFHVAMVADEKLANDIYTLSIDSRGRVVVAGRGYIRILVDDDADGIADRAIAFSDSPKDGAMGMLWEGRTLWATGDGGLRRFQDRDGDDRADGPGELVCKLQTGGEHSAHAIRRGPDGFLYVLCGNNTGIDRTYAHRPDSPIREPIAGAVLRFDPDLGRCEIFADGFRNAYDMDFNLDGELFAYDSDNERCVSLPWYEPTRLYHVLPGGRHGWLSPQRTETWRMPGYWPDVAAPVAAIARGSPTGVVCYRHQQFPERYRGGFFLLDWTFGKVHFVPAARTGASYTGRPEVFIEPTGDNGFAPTDAAVHPQTGDLFVSIGGRGTRGAVYRITYPEGVRSFGRAELTRLAPATMSWEWSPERAAELLRRAADSDSLQRLHALEAIRRGGTRLPIETVEAAVFANWGHTDKNVRLAAGRLIAGLPPERQRALLDRARQPLETATWCLALAGARPDWVLGPALGLLGRGFVRAPITGAATAPEFEMPMTAIRALQLAAGDVAEPRRKGTVFEGYSRRGAADVTAALPALRDLYPTGEPRLDRELTRLLAMLEDSDGALRQRIVAQLTGSSDPVDDIHHLIVLARLRGPRADYETRQTARAFLSLDRKLIDAERNRDRNWPLRIDELFAELLHKDPKLPEAMLADAEFGRPDHARFAAAAGFPRERAARVFLARIRNNPEYVWSGTLVELLSCLPAAEVLPLARRQWDEPGLRDSLVHLLARKPQSQDRARFLSALASTSIPTVRRCIAALEQLPGHMEPNDILIVLGSARRLPEDGEGPRLRERLLGCLARALAMESKPLSQWLQWFEATYPNLAHSLTNPDGVDLVSWNRRYAGIDWTRGDAAAGREVFRKAACQSCHSGALAVGPDLRGVAARFSRQDLFTAIVQPSRDVSARYQTTILADADGAVYQGVVIYEAVDAVILQTGQDQTVRVDAGRIVGRRPGATSLMPTGLLDKLSDAEIADLYGYLKTIR